MDWLSFALGFLINFALIGIGVTIAAVVVTVRKSKSSGK